MLWFCRPCLCLCPGRIDWLLMRFAHSGISPVGCDDKVYKHIGKSQAEMHTMSALSRQHPSAVLPCLGILPQKPQEEARERGLVRRLKGVDSAAEMGENRVGDLESARLPRACRGIGRHQPRAFLHRYQLPLHVSRLPHDFVGVTLRLSAIPASTRTARVVKLVTRGCDCGEGMEQM